MAPHPQRDTTLGRKRSVLRKHGFFAVHVISDDDVRTGARLARQIERAPESRRQEAVDDFQAWRARMREKAHKK